MRPTRLSVLLLLMLSGARPGSAPAQPAAPVDPDDTAPGPDDPEPGAAPASPGGAPAPAAEVMAPSSFAGADAAVEAAPVETVSTEMLPVKLGGAAPSLAGSAGLLRMSSAETGEPGQLRVGLHGEYFTGQGFLIKRDRNTRLGGALTLGVTPIRNLELFGALLGTANRNRRVCPDDGGPCVSEADRADPEIVKALGDIVFGIKYAKPLANGISLAGEGGMRLLSSVTGLSVDPGATSFWIGGVTTYDLRPAKSVPLRFHVNAGYYLDNSDELLDFTGISRASQAVTTFAYGMGRDRVRTAVGFDVPLANQGKRVHVTPFFEYHLDIITADANAAFDDYLPPKCGAAGGAPCSDNVDQHWIGFGVRTQALRGLTFDLGVELAVRSVGWPYGPPLPPYNIVFGVGHPLDLGGPRIVTRTIEKKVEVARRAPGGFVTGSVVSARGQQPVAGALVAVSGKPLSRVATDPDGSFMTRELPPGPMELEITAPGFETARVPAHVAIGQTTDLQVALVASAPPTQISGKVLDERGNPIEATVRFVGAKNAEARTDASGGYDAGLVAGLYVVRVEAETFFAKEQRIELGDGERREMTFRLRRKPARPSVQLRGGAIVLRQAIAWQTTKGAPTAELKPTSLAVLDEVADLMIVNSDLRRLRVEAHWDSGLSKAKAEALTNDQARAITKYLADQGIAADRLVAVGMGSTKPRAPNLSRAGRMKNRRVELYVSN